MSVPARSVPPPASSTAAPASSTAAADGQAVPVHPERTDDPRTFHWPLPCLVRGPTGLAEAAAEPLQALVDGGVLEGFDLGDSSIDTRLATEHTWTDHLGAVRAGVRAAVTAAGRHLDRTDPAHRDALIGSVAAEIAAELITPLARSHGGSMEVSGVRDGLVSVRLHGACHGCPAATNTVQDVFGAQLRRRLPGVAGVRVSAENGARTGFAARLLARRGRTEPPDSPDARAGPPNTRAIWGKVPR